MMRRTLLTMGAVLLLSACESVPLAPPASPPRSDLQFVDLPSFDRDLTNALLAPLPQVDITFYDRVLPSALPDRLQYWMSAVEAGGGVVKVQPPASGVTSKSPFMLLSAISTLWTASKMAADISGKNKFKAAQHYNAEIQLKVDAGGQTVLDRVVFVPR